MPATRPASPHVGPDGYPTDRVALDEVPDLAAGPEGRYAQFWPHVHGTDAMFLALLRKRNG